MLRSQHQNPTRTNEQGFASIVIALILIIVLALFTVGFAQLARREQKSALDKQLANQAYYAAESGVNDTVQNLATLATKPNTPNSCQPGGPVTIGPSQNGVQYTCVLVNLTPPNILFDNIQPEATRYITSSTTTAASTITVNWGSTDGNNTFANNTNDQFLPAGDWNSKKYPAVLQFSLTPLADLSRTGLMNNTFNIFLYPVKNGSSRVAYSSSAPGNPGATNGTIVAANCDTANDAIYPCKATVTGLNFGTGPYLFRVIDHYDPSNISINGQNLIGRPVGFDGQPQIDVTGKAHEVLKRLQVRVPLHGNSFDIPKDALDATNACKRFTTDPISDSQPAPALAEDTANACQLN